MPKRKKINNTTKLSIVIPAKNEEDNLKELLPRLKKSLPQIKQFKKNQIEIIVICDSCTDNTEKVAKSHKVKVFKVSHSEKTKTLLKGFSESKGNIIVMMDADLSHLPEDLPKMVNKLLSRKNIGLVVASRITGGSDDATAIREFGGVAFNKLVNLFFRTKLTDAINGYKIFKREVFENYQYTAGGYAIEIELVANTVRAGMKVEEIPGFEAARKHDKAKSKILEDGWIFLSEIFTEGISYQLEKLASRIKNAGKK